MPTQVKRESSKAHSHSQMAICTMVAAAERWRKSRPRFPVYDDEESDSAQADEEPLTGSRARTTSLADIDASTLQRRAVVSISR